MAGFVVELQTDEILVNFIASDAKGVSLNSR